MYCKKCYIKLDEDWKYCPNCSNIIKEENVEYDEEKIKQIKEKENKKSIIYLIVFILCFACMIIFNDIGGIFFIGSLITAVTGYISCPNSIIIKVMFWMFLIFIVFAVISMIVIAVMCGQAFISCLSSFGG